VAHHAGSNRFGRKSSIGGVPKSLLQKKRKKKEKQTTKTKYKKHAAWVLRESGLLNIGEKVEFRLSSKEGSH